MKAPLIERAGEAFATYHGLGREIIDELIFALTVANEEIVRLQAGRLPPAKFKFVKRPKAAVGLSELDMLKFKHIAENFSGNMSQFEI